ncbi:MAG: glycosyltransferase [Candidatus Melainabacteria bacterium]|nr:glycosyltransferase [Candidatus Melainabacteria bacterium]
MKILHIISSYYPATRIGGPIQSVRGLNIELVKSGVSVDVITTNSGLIKEEIRLNEWVDDNGVAVKYLPYLFGRNYNFSLSLFFEIVGNVKKYDLVHITSVWNFPIVAGVISCYLKRKPYVISPRGVLYEEAINIKSKQIKKLYYFLLAQHYLKKASAMHFTSEHERDNVADFVSCSKDSFVVPNGVDLKIA